MINLTNKIQMTYNAGFIVINIFKLNKDGVEKLQGNLTYLKPESARKGILSQTGVDVPIEQIKQAKADLIKQYGIELGVSMAESKAAKLKKAEADNES